MSIFQSIIFFISLSLLIIGAHQTFTVGLYESYWLFMLSLALLFLYSILKKNKEKEEEEKKTKKNQGGKKKSSRKK